MKKRYLIFGLGTVLALSLTVPAAGGPSNPVATTAQSAAKALKVAKRAVRMARRANSRAGAAQNSANAARSAANAANANANTRLQNIVGFAQGTVATIPAATFTQVLSTDGVEGSGTLDTSGLPTAQHRILVNASVNVATDGTALAASHVQCKLQRSLGGGPHQDFGADSNADIAAAAPAGGSDDATIALTGVTENPKSSVVNIRVVCNPFNGAVIARGVGLTAIAVPRP